MDLSTASCEFMGECQVIVTVVAGKWKLWPRLVMRVQNA